MCKVITLFETLFPLCYFFRSASLFTLFICTFADTRPLLHRCYRKILDEIMYYKKIYYTFDYATLKTATPAKFEIKKFKSNLPIPVMNTKYCNSTICRAITQHIRPCTISHNAYIRKAIIITHQGHLPYTTKFCRDHYCKNVMFDDIL